MEKHIKINVSKQFNVYGRLSGLKSQPLFVMVPGLGANINYDLYSNAVRWFAGHGYATFRFAFYGWQRDARQLMDCTLRTQADDLDKVIAHFRRKGYRKIFVAGHSYGGPTILLSRKQDFDAVSVWDPSYKASFTRKQYGVPGGTYLKQAKGYLMNWGTNIVIGEKMAHEADTLAWDELTKRFHQPVQIVVAGKGVLMAGAKRYYKTAHEPKNFVVIKGAGHAFDKTPGMQDQVYANSHKWFRLVDKS